MTDKQSLEKEKEEVRYDAKNHRYYIGGVEVPGLTAILSAAGLIDTDHMTDYGRDRGTYVHQATELYDQDNLDEANLSPALIPYLTAYKRFRIECAFTPLHVEKILYCVLRRYGTRVDRIGAFGRKQVIVELKTGKEAPWHALQTAGQLVAARANGIRVDERYALYLKPSGDYCLRRHDSKDEEPAFLSLLAAYHVVKNYKGGQGNGNGTGT